MQQYLLYLFRQQTDFKMSLTTCLAYIPTYCAKYGRLCRCFCDKVAWRIIDITPRGDGSCHLRSTGVDNWPDYNAKCIRWRLACTSSISVTRSSGAVIPLCRWPTPHQFIPDDAAVTAAAAAAVLLVFDKATRRQSIDGRERRSPV